MVVGSGQLKHAPRSGAGERTSLMSWVMVSSCLRKTETDGVQCQ